MRKRFRKLGFNKEEEAAAVSSSSSQIGSFRLSAWCLYPCFILSISWIFLLSLNSIFFRTDGLQGTPSNSLPWSVTWLKGAMADKNVIQKHHEFNHATEKGDTNASKPSFKDSTTQSCLTPQNCKCSSSFDHNFLPLFLGVCLTRSFDLGTKSKDLDSKSRNLVRKGKPYKGGVYSGINSVDLNNEPICNGMDDCEKQGIGQLSPPSGQDEACANAEQKITVDGEVATDSNGMNSTSVTPVEVLNKTHHILTSNLSNIHVRQEIGDGPYNYASDSKGAKILASNKEAKGASSILNGDKDKYLRTPCSVENKYVDMELSEETLVVTIAIANHEFYSSNVKQFELWGSLVYPTEEWVFLGRFEADNIRVTQTFKLNEPKWVRYLKVQMLSHYGSDFYCTLSVLEVYGVDAIEWFLEDWIAEESGAGSRASLAGSFSQEESLGKGGPNLQLTNQVLSGEVVLERDPSPMQTHETKDLPIERAKEILEVKERPENYNFREVSKGDKAQPVYHQTGRPALDAVMKLLMQKVRSLEQNQPLLSHYIQELNDRCEKSLRGFDRDLALITGKLDAGVAELANLKSSFRNVERRWMHEKYVLENDLSNHIKMWNADMELLRNHLKNTENKEMVALAVALLSTLAIVAAQILILCMPLVRLFQQNMTGLSTWSPCAQTLWVVPFLSCVVVVFVLSL